MQAANRFKVEPFADHFVVRFGASSSADAGDQGTEVASIILPMTTASSLAVDLLEGVFKGTVALNEFFLAFNTRVGKLNELSNDIKAKAGKQ